MCKKKEQLTIEIPIEVLKANFDRSGYYARHRFYYREFKGQRGAGRMAWEALEAELSQYCLPGRYSSYNAFLSKRSEWIKNR